MLLEIFSLFCNLLEVKSMIVAKIFVFITSQSTKQQIKHEIHVVFTEGMEGHMQKIPAGKSAVLKTAKWNLKGAIGYICPKPFIYTQCLNFSSCLLKIPQVVYVDHANIIKDCSSPLCRMCNKYDETIDHIVSGCPELAKTEYIHRHGIRSPRHQGISPPTNSPPGKLSRIQRKKYRLLQSKIFKHWEDYNANEISARRLLKLCSYINGPSARCWAVIFLKTAPLGATGPLRGATKSSKVMTNTNLCVNCVVLLLFFFFF